MATDYFNDSSTDHLFSTAANWSNGTVPTDVDITVLEGGRTNNSMIGETVTTDFDGLTFGARKNYTGDIGSSGSPLIFDNAGAMAFAKVELFGTGQYWLQLAVDATCDECTVNVGGKLAEQVNLSGPGIWSLVNVLAGRVSFEATNAGTVEIRVGWGVGPMDSHVDIDPAAKVTTIRQGGGRIISDSTTGIATWEIMGGSALVQGAALTITDLIVGAGTFQWDPSGGTPVVTNLFVYGGLMDLTKSGDDRVITNAVVFPGGVLDVRGVEDSVTFTNRPFQFGPRAKVLGDVNPKVI